MSSTTNSLTLTDLPVLALESIGKHVGPEAKDVAAMRATCITLKNAVDKGLQALAVGRVKAFKSLPLLPKFTNLRILTLSVYYEMKQDSSLRFPVGLRELHLTLESIGKASTPLHTFVQKASQLTCLSLEGQDNPDFRFDARKECRASRGAFSRYLCAQIGLGRLPKLATLRLVNMDVDFQMSIDFEDEYQLPNLLKSSSLTHLDLSRQIIGNLFDSALVKIGASTQLQKLTLNDMAAYTFGRIPANFAAITKSFRIPTLELRDNGLGLRWRKELHLATQAIESNKHIRTLDLSKNKLSHKDVPHICSLLLKGSLTSLDLSDNPQLFFNAGSSQPFQEIAAAVQKSKLTELRLDNCFNLFVKKLFHQFPYTTFKPQQFSRLRLLSLRGNKLTPKKIGRVDPKRVRM